MTSHMLASSVSYTAFDTLDVYFDDVAESCLPLRIILLCTLNLFNAIWTYAPTSFDIIVCWGISMQSPTVFYDEIY